MLSFPISSLALYKAHKKTVKLKKKFYKVVEITLIKARLTTKYAIPLSPYILIVIKFV